MPIESRTSLVGTPDTTQTGGSKCCDILPSSPASNVIDVNDRPVVVLATGLNPGDFLQLQMSVDGVVWADWMVHGQAVGLSSDNTSMVIRRGGRFRFVSRGANAPAARVCWYEITMTHEPDNEPLVKPDLRQIISTVGNDCLVVREDPPGNVILDATGCRDSVSGVNGVAVTQTASNHYVIDGTPLLSEVSRLESLLAVLQQMLDALTTRVEDFNIAGSQYISSVEDPKDTWTISLLTNVLCASDPCAPDAVIEPPPEAPPSPAPPPPPAPISILLAPDMPLSLNEGQIYAFTWLFDRVGNPDTRLHISNIQMPIGFRATVRADSVTISGTPTKPSPVEYIGFDVSDGSYKLVVTPTAVTIEHCVLSLVTSPPTKINLHTNDEVYLVWTFSNTDPGELVASEPLNVAHSALPPGLVFHATRNAVSLRGKVSATGAYFVDFAVTNKCRQLEVPMTTITVSE